MKATKFKVCIEIECLSMATVPGLLIEIESHLNNENMEGKLIKTDGDSIEWSTISSSVEF